MSVELKNYRFAGQVDAPIGDLTTLNADDKARLLLAGIDATEIGRSGSFMHMNYSGVHCHSKQEGLELLDVKDALRMYDGLPQFFWKAVDRSKDEFTRSTDDNLHGGYFIRAKKGAHIIDPVQSCLFIKDSGVGQNIHNIVIVEEGAEMHIISGCVTSRDTKNSAHIGISEFYVAKGGKLTFTMIHNWGSEIDVRPRSAGILEEGASFVSNYVLLDKVRDLQMYPSIALNGRGAVARFNSVMVAPEGSYIDAGNKIVLNAPDTKGEIIAKTLTTGGTIINRGFIGGYAAPAKAHLECKGLILGGGRIHAIPELDGNIDGVELSHEAAVGKIAQEEIEYLMARGLDENEATSTIVRGFLNVDIMGLPHELQEAMDKQIDLLNTGNAM